MNYLDKRIAALEAQTVTDGGQWHRVICDPGMSEGEAIDRYGRERVQPGDRIVMRSIVLEPAVQVLL